MKQVIPFVALMTLASPALAQDHDDDGMSLMERGAQLFFEGMMKEIEPAIDELQGLAEQFGPSVQSFLNEMGPALGEMMDTVEDWSVYDPPELLPNGDIIIRRKPDPEPPIETEI